MKFLNFTAGCNCWSSTCFQLSWQDFANLGFEKVSRYPFRVHNLTNPLKLTWILFVICRHVDRLRNVSTCMLIVEIYLYDCINLRSGCIYTLKMVIDHGELANHGSVDCNDLPDMKFRQNKQTDIFGTREIQVFLQIRIEVSCMFMFDCTCICMLLNIKSIRTLWIKSFVLLELFA